MAEGRESRNSRLRKDCSAQRSKRGKQQWIPEMNVLFTCRTYFPEIGVAASCV
jgi:hypothetical protein